MKTTMGKRKKFFKAVAEGIVALSVAFNFVSCGKKTKTEATVLSLGISADDEAAEADMGNIVPFENIRVLLAEDNELNSEIASVLLRENGIEVECAANGKQVCDMFFAHKEHYYDDSDGRDDARDGRYCRHESDSFVRSSACENDSHRGNDGKRVRGRRA